jgi:hypothetical protein
MSSHNIDVHGEVLAADFFCPWIKSQDEVRHVFNRMRELGFTGIGVYADTQFNGNFCPMFHGDVRTTHKMGSPATWGRIAGKKGYSINQAIGACF